MTPYVKTASYDIGASFAAGLAVAVLSDGSFITTWDDYGFGQIRAQHISASGELLGGSFTVFAGPQGAAEPYIAALGNGGYIISWISTDSSGTDVMARVFDAADTSPNGAFVVNTTTGGYHAAPSVTTLADGSVVMAWRGGSPASIDAQHFSASGAPIGGEIQVTAPAPSESDVFPSVSALANGGYVIAWMHGNADSTIELKAQTFGADGAPVGSPVTINDVPLNYHGDTQTLSVVGLSTGGFAVAYESTSVPGGSDADIALQFYSDDGSRTSGVILANEGDLPSWQVGISAVALPGGKVAVSWNDGNRVRGVDFAVFDSTGAAISGPQDAGQDVGIAFLGGPLALAATADGKLVTATRPLSLHDADPLILQVFSPNDFHIASGGGGASADYAIAENSSAVATIGTTGATSPVSFSIQGGSDSALFQIDPTTGALSFIAAPDYEAPADQGHDNIYNVIVRAQSGTDFDDQAIAVTVTDATDIFTGDAAKNTLTGTNGVDLIYGLGNNDTLYGLGGNDTLDGGTGNDIMYGGMGDDTYIVDSATDKVIELADQGTDTVLTALASVKLADNVENLTFTYTGTSAAKGIGNAAANVMTGAAGVDTLQGNDGDDTLRGMDGNDILSGGNGNDVLDGGTGADSMTGGAGDDRFIVDNAGDVVRESAGGGYDRVESSVSFTLAANVEDLTLTGMAAINGTGNAAANVLMGNEADNILFGAAGNDTLRGGGGNDTLNGGTGQDTLTGGQGADTFLFASKSTATLGSTADLVTDFSRAEGDMLAFSKAVFTAIGAIGGLTADAFYTGTSAHDATDRVIYDVGSGNLYYDPDGTGRQAQVLVATIGTATHAALAFDDFLIVA